MVPFRIDVILSGFRALESACQNGDPNQYFFVPELPQRLSVLATECRTSGLTFTSTLLDRLSNAYRNSQPSSREELSRHLHECLHRLQDELAQPRFYSIAPEKLEFLRQYPPFFPSEVTAPFPAASKELSEATRCYAFERNTSCVFHLMRALEIVLKAFAKRIGAAFETRNWGDVIAAIEPKLDPKETEDAEILAYLRSIKNAWRNSTMHVERDYDQDQAFDILRNTKSFMNHVARRLKSSRSQDV
jgi:hypothetical protein